MTHSPQMANLLRRYGVAEERDLVRAIRAEYRRETDGYMTIREAEATLDQMLEAEYQRIEGGAYDRDYSADAADDRSSGREDEPR